ncbi:MAG: DUF441 domain-containing protein [Bacilli bacterium]
MKKGGVKVAIQPLAFMIGLLVIGYFAKNSSLMWAVVILLVLQLLKLDERVFPVLQSKGIMIGITIITIAVLVPVATGEIGMQSFIASLKSPIAWIALVSGIAVALIAKNGVVLLAEDPLVTTALVFGTIIAVGFFGGVAVGPLIGAGIAYLAMQCYSFFIQ